jgi:hypothetical protein
LPASAKSQQNKILAAGTCGCRGKPAVLEGDWCPPRLVLLEFEDLEAAKRWYDSEVYREARKLREGAANFRAIHSRRARAPALSEMQARYVPR